MGVDTILITAIFWIAIAVIAVAASFFSYMSRSSRYRMLQAMVDKGQPLPPEVVANLADAASTGPRHSLRAGIILICIGIALAIFFWALTGGFGLGSVHVVTWLPAIGVFPFMIGVALLLIAVFDRHPTRPKS